MKLLTTNRPADNFFDGMVVFCIAAWITFWPRKSQRELRNEVFFSLEVIICCLGKDDYFLSFFFALDVRNLISTRCFEPFSRA